MLIVLSSVEDAFALRHNLDRSFFDKVASFSENRAKTYLAGRALLQSVLQHFYSINKIPDIKRTERGKPYFEDRCVPFFNISHSKNIICVGLSEFDLGIDLEFVKKRVRFEELKQKVLSSGEINFIEKLDIASQLKEFTSFWTMRESVLKLSGFGLSHLEKVKVDFEKNKVDYDGVSSDRTDSKFINTLNLDQYNELPWAEAYLSYSICQGEVCSLYKLDKDRFIKLSSPKLKYVFTVN